MQRQEKESLKSELLSQLDKALMHAGNSPDRPVAIDRRGWNNSAFATKYDVHGPEGTALIRTSQCSFIDGGARIAQPIASVREFYQKFGRNNALFKFVSCAGFLGPLLSIIRDPPQPIFLLVGAPHTGKSTLLLVAGSPWGGDQQGPLGYVSSLSGTTNAIEAKAAEHREMLFTLDDVQNLTPEPGQRGRAIFDILLRISSGRVRARLGEKDINYRTVVLAASNDPTTALLKHAHISSPDALLDRVFDYPAGIEHGAFASVPDGEVPDQFVRAMKARANAVRGAAGEHFIRDLVKANASDRDSLRKKLRRWRKEVSELLADPRLSPRAIDAFACVFAAGCLAAEFGILPWEHDVLLRQVKTVFDGHVVFTKGELAKVDPIKLVKRYIAKNGHQFLKVRKGEARRLSDKALSECAGVEMTLRDGTKQYWLRVGDMDKALDKKVDRRVAEKKLLAQGLIKLDNEGKPPKHSLGSGRPRLYRIDAKKLQKLG